VPSNDAGRISRHEAANQAGPSHRCQSSLRTECPRNQAKSDGEGCNPARRPARPNGLPPSSRARWARIAVTLPGSKNDLPEAGDPGTTASTPPGEAESTFHLIRRYRAGDKQALELLFARHLPRLRRWATGRLPKWARSASDTEDLVQETLLKTFNQIEGFEPTREGALQAYLRQAVMNRIRDEIRRKGRRPERSELEGTEIVDPARSPLEEAIGLEEIERYENALGRLRPEEREVIILRVELGYTYEEVARLLEKPTSGAAHKATKRALVRLAEEMARGG
jgi:RNA polymerase sigma factor (sigma-70 family)